MATHRIEILITGEKAAKALARFLASEVPANFVEANDGKIDGLLVISLPEVIKGKMEEENAQQKAS